MYEFATRTVRAAQFALAAWSLLSACAAQASPPPALPIAPPPVVAIPARPLPPFGAVASMHIPVRDASGTRQSVNANLTSAQTTWNLRSALNVAALNCREPRYAPLVASYTSFLKTHARRLSAIDRALEAEFRRKSGARFRDVRDGYATQVYNYFALPPTLPSFCEAALGISSELALVAPADLDTFAATALPRLEAVFEAFFQSFDQYRIERAAWDARYGPQAGMNPARYADPRYPAAVDPTAPRRPFGTLVLPPAASPVPETRAVIGPSPEAARAPSASGGTADPGTSPSPAGALGAGSGTAGAPRL